MNEEFNESTPPVIPFQEVIEALLDADTPLPPRYLYRFSDLEAGDGKPRQDPVCWRPSLRLG